MEKAEKFWDRISRNYDHNDKGPSASYLKTIEDIKLYIDENSVVLDLGCATGTRTIDISDDAKEVHGIDISSKMIQIANTKVEQGNNANIIFTRARVFDERLKEESFDLIISFNVLHLLDNLPLVIQRIYRLLKPGGVFISSTPCMGDKKILFGLLILLLRKTGILPHVAAISSTELHAEIIKPGLRIIEGEIVGKNKLNYFVVAEKD